MTRVLISNRAQRDFAMIPNAIWRAKISFAAKGAACYLFSLRDGSMPYVAEMEEAMGLGRDARRKAFAVLEKAGFVEWVTDRNARGAIVAKTLVLHADAFDEVQPESHAPEIQGHGEKAQKVAASHHAPENPAGGFSTPARVEIRPCIDGKSGDTLRQDKTKKAREAAAAARSAAAVSLSRSSGDAQAVAERAAVAASLGLPVLDKSAGVWRSAGAAFAMNGGGHA